jgi:hypothetical protein
MNVIITGAAMALMVATAGATETGPTSVFFTGNDVHEFCQRKDPFHVGVCRRALGSHISRRIHIRVSQRIIPAHSVGPLG